MSFSSFRGASWPRGQTCISWVSCIASGFFTCWAIRKETYFVLVSVKECSSSSFFQFIFYLKDVFFSIFSLTVIIIFLYLWYDRQIMSIHSFPTPTTVILSTNIFSTLNEQPLKCQLVLYILESTIQPVKWCLYSHGSS